jgi:hypothetical protein
MSDYFQQLGVLVLITIGLIGALYIVAMLSGIFAATYEFHKLKRMARLNKDGGRSFMIVTGNVGQVQAISEIVVRTLHNVQLEQQNNDPGFGFTEEVITKVGVNDSTKKEDDPRAEA